MKPVQVKITDPTIAPKLSKEFVETKGIAAAVCFKKAKKKSGVILTVNGHFNKLMMISWDKLDNKVLNTYADDREITEWGAEAIAFAIVEFFTSYRCVKRSQIGTGFDYYLTEDDSTLFQGKIAKLEVSGILSIKRNSDISKRLSLKTKQATDKYKNMPFYVIIIAFSAPVAEVYYGNHGRKTS
jgi:hypothetical protein